MADYSVCRTEKSFILHIVMEMGSVWMRIFLAFHRPNFQIEKMFSSLSLLFFLFSSLYGNHDKLNKYSIFFPEFMLATLPKLISICHHPWCELFSIIVGLNVINRLFFFFSGKPFILFLICHGVCHHQNDAKSRIDKLWRLCTVVEISVKCSQFITVTHRQEEELLIY